MTLWWLAAAHGSAFPDLAESFMRWAKQSASPAHVATRMRYTMCICYARLTL